jgi:hypothetical protein
MTILFILWSLAYIFTISSIMPDIENAPALNQIIVVIIISICSPILVLASFIDTIICILLPEGWDDDDFKRY